MANDPTAKVFEEVSRKCRSRNTMVHCNCQPSIPTFSTTVHSVTDRRTHRRTDDSVMPRADHTACSKYDRLKDWLAVLKVKMYSQARSEKIHITRAARKRWSRATHSPHEVQLGYCSCVDQRTPRSALYTFVVHLLSKLTTGIDYSLILYINYNAFVRVTSCHDQWPHARLQ